MSSHGTAHCGDGLVRSLRRSSLSTSCIRYATPHRSSGHAVLSHRVLPSMCAADTYTHPELPTLLTWLPNLKMLQRCCIGLQWTLHLCTSRDTMHQQAEMLSSNDSKMLGEQLGCDLPPDGLHLHVCSGRYARRPPWRTNGQALCEAPGGPGAINAEQVRARRDNQQPRQGAAALAHAAMPKRRLDLHFSNRAL